MRLAFFGTPEIAVTALEVLKTDGFLPDLLVTNPDAPTGRKQLLTPPPAKIWAEEHKIPVFQPNSLKDANALKPLTDQMWDFFIVLAYGKIMPKWLLDLPKYGTINAHPSLLPKLRGASPIRSTLLMDLSACGVTIMQMDEKMDHGDILLQEPYPLPFPISGLELDGILAKRCGELLAEALAKIPSGEITPTPQNHEAATFCQKINKEMAELTLDPFHLPVGDEALAVYRKICAFDGWPETFFFYNGKRIKIKQATITNNQLQITRIVPEGKKEMDFGNYFR